MWRIGLALTWILQRVGLVDMTSVRLLSETTRRLLSQAESVEVFSLGGADAGGGAFHNAPILGSVVVANKAVRKRLLNRILLANRYNMGGFLCLGAEYGVRVRAGETVLDLTFCFDCAQVWVNGSKDYHDQGTIAAFPVSLLKVILIRAGIPLPPPTLQ